MYKGDLRDFTRPVQPPENRKANVSPQLFPFFPEPHKISFEIRMRTVRTKISKNLGYFNQNDYLCK